MAKPVRKQSRGRPPKHGEAMTGAERQALYAKARQRDMAEVGYALQQVLEIKTARTAFVRSYRGTPSGLRLQRGLARILVLKEDRDLLASFDALLASDDEDR
jgi:beta-glucosidase-like glycosyl hydrolase